MKALFRKFTASAGALLCVLGLAGCSDSARKPAAEPSAPANHHSIPSPQQIAPGRELMCLAKTREEAEAVAECYGIELVDFEYGVAVFHTEENPFDVIRRGKENGWTILSANTITKIS